MSKIKLALDWIIPLLKSKEIPFHITGGFAAHLYGASRAVNDIDIDLPTSCLDSLLPELNPNYDTPVQRYRDTTWDLYLCTLNYHGQLIDLTGDSEPYIRNKSTGNWDAMDMNFDQVVWTEGFGHMLPLQNPNDLISYKLKIEYDEAKHLDDVEAVRRYVRENK